MKTVTAIDPLTTQTLADDILGIELGDKRLNRRAGKVIEQLGRQPRNSIPSAIRGWSETRSAYDLLAHKNTEAQKILQPHYQSTLERIKSYPRVLVAQDTTELDYTGKNNIVGLGTRPIRIFKRFLTVSTRSNQVADRPEVPGKPSPPANIWRPIMTWPGLI